MKKSVQDRFLAKIVASPNGCWIWQSGTNADGYGLFRVDGRMVRAHRFAYELLVGPIPEGLELDHLCRVRNCVNPAHMEPVTHAENMRRGAHALKTHCPREHPYAGGNLYIAPDGKRRCWTCKRAADRAYKARKAQATTCLQAAYDARQATEVVA